MKGFKQISAPIIKADKSALSFFEKGKEIDFDIRRIYYIYNLPEAQQRGFHAHKHLKQVLFCPWGSIKVILKDGETECSVFLDSPEKLLILDGGLWREFTSLKENSVLCVGASEIYDEQDYIRDYNEYLKWICHE